MTRMTCDEAEKAYIHEIHREIWIFCSTYTLHVSSCKVAYISSNQIFSQVQSQCKFVSPSPGSIF